MESTNLSNLQGFYSNRAPSLNNWFSGAYPGFKDFYAQGGWGNTLFTIDYSGTLQSTLSLSQSSNAKYLQLITWNDYGEGTMIEPTLDYNFNSLQTLQAYTGVKYSLTELQLVYKWYTLRTKYAGNATVEAQLTKAYNDLAGLNVSGATAVINGVK